MTGIQNAEGKFIIYVNLTKDFRKLKSLINDEFAKIGKQDQIDVRLTPKVLILM